MCVFKIYLNQDPVQVHALLLVDVSAESLSNCLFSFQFCCFFLCVFWDSVIRYTYFYNCYIFFINLEILSLVIIFVLRSILSDIITAISALFAWYFFSNTFTFNLFVFLNLIDSV